MSLDRFISEIEPGTLADTFEKSDKISYGIIDIENANISLEFPKGNWGVDDVKIDPKLELHIYDDENNLLNSIYDIDFIENENTSLGLSPEKDLEDNGYSIGNYTLVYNPIYNFAGSFLDGTNDYGQIIISEISPDRTEVKLKLASNFRLGLINDIQRLEYQSQSYSFTAERPEFLLNFGQNNIYDIAKIHFQGQSYTTFDLPTGTFGLDNSPTIWLPTNFPKTERGYAFEEYYKNSVSDEGGVEKYYEPTGRQAFFKDVYTQNDAGFIEGKWEIEKYDETGYTVGYNFDRSFLGAPFYIYNSTAGILKQIDDLTEKVLSKWSNDEDEKAYWAGIAANTGISIGTKYDPPGQNFGFAIITGATAVVFLGINAAGVPIATAIGASVLASTLAAGGTAAGTAAATAANLSLAITSTLGPIAIVVGAIALGALVANIVDKENFYAELDRTQDLYNKEVKNLVDARLKSKWGIDGFQAWIGLGTEVNRNNLSAALDIINEASAAVEKIDKEIEFLRARGVNDRVKLRYQRCWLIILLHVKAWIDAHSTVYDFDYALSGTNADLFKTSQNGVYVQTNRNDSLITAVPISRATSLTSANILSNAINADKFIPSSFSSLYVKLTQPISGDIGIGDSLSIGGRLQQSFTDKVYKAILIEPEEPISLQPNFNIELDKYGKSDGTDFKVWNDLLGSNLSTSQQIINSYFSGSFGNIELNTDYSDFSNFVHYSSATERVDNFFYKLQTIETYNSRIQTLQQVSGSHALTNISQSISRRDTLIGGFDGFEKWMYESVSASLYTHYLTSPNTIVPYPKQTIYPTIAFYPTTSSQAESWYEGVYSSASLYDSQNESALINLIPISLREDKLNDDYLLFINMIGQHFDILWVYISSLTDINKREEHPNDGMSDDLLYSVAKSMGWNLSNGWGQANLWEYILGTDSLGNKTQTTNNLNTKSKQKIRSEVWRRVLNNLPYIYKTKGTPRSIKALLSCYGIPEVFLKIREYGGPVVEENPNIYESERFIYKVETTDSKPIRNPFGTINGSRPNSIEVIGKMPLGDFTIGRLTGGGTDLNFEWNYSGGQARILAKTGSSIIMSSSYMNYKSRRDGSFGIVSGSSTTIYAAFKDDFGNVLASLSATSPTANTIFGSSTQFIVGDGVEDYATTASIQEIRYYSSSLSQEIFEEHAKNTEAYFSDDNTTDLNNTFSYKNLVYRIFPDSGFTSLPTAISSSHPNQFFKTTSGGSPLTASLPNHIPSDLVGEVDTQFTKIPSVGALNLNNNKVRIESSVLSSSLDVDKTAEVSQYDYTPLDSNLVGLYFSSTDIVNNDIYNSEGYFEVDDWVGDPDDRFNEDYPQLRYRATKYFDKYVNLTAASGSAQKRGTAISLLLNMLSIYDHSIFQQVKQLIPARSEYIGGVLLEPHILERNKYKRGDKWSHTRVDYPLLLTKEIQNIESTKQDYLGTLPIVLTTTGFKNDYLGTLPIVLTTTGFKNDYLGTADVKDFHEGAIYKYTYPILSSSIFGQGVYVNVFNAYWEQAATSSIMNQRLSPHAKQYMRFYSSSLSASLGKYYSSSLFAVPCQTDEIPASLENLKFNGCNSQIICPIDGKPSVEINSTDPFVVGVAPQNLQFDTTVQSAVIPTITNMDRSSGAASVGRLFRR